MSVVNIRDYAVKRLLDAIKDLSWEELEGIKEPFLEMVAKLCEHAPPDMRKENLERFAKLFAEPQEGDS